MIVRASGIGEALYLAERSPAWLARRSNVPLCRVLRLRRLGTLERRQRASVRAVRAVLAIAGVSLTADAIAMDGAGMPAE